MKNRSAVPLLLAASLCFSGCSAQQQSTEDSSFVSTALTESTAAESSTLTESTITESTITENTVTESTAAETSASKSASGTSESADRDAVLLDVFYTVYSDDRAAYESDAVFANFRAVKGGNLKENLFYRSASPCYNIHRRASYANRFAEEAGVQFVLNLSDTAASYELFRVSEGFDSLYYDSLAGSGNVMFLALDTYYFSENFTQAISGALLEMTAHGTPCLIHCVEGMHRTGFVCALLLALADASADEILDDYMITFANYHGITAQSQPVQYAAVRSYGADLLCALCGMQPGTAEDSLPLKQGAENYLRTGGLTDEQIAKIEAFIVK